MSLLQILRGKEISFCGLYKPLVVLSNIYVLYFLCVSLSLRYQYDSANATSFVKRSPGHTCLGLFSEKNEGKKSVLLGHVRAQSAFPDELEAGKGRLLVDLWAEASLTSLRGLITCLPSILGGRG